MLSNTFFISLGKAMLFFASFLFSHKNVLMADGAVYIMAKHLAIDAFAAIPNIPLCIFNNAVAVRAFRFFFWDFTTLDDFDVRRSPSREESIFD